MNRIELTKNQKKILFSLSNGDYPQMVPQRDIKDFVGLKLFKLATGSKMIGNEYVSPQLTDEGRIYLLPNPKLKNPSIWEDKKFWISTTISVIALAVAIIALLI